MTTNLKKYTHTTIQGVPYFLNTNSANVTIDKGKDIDMDKDERNNI